MAKEYHDDGSYTVREDSLYFGEVSTTYNPDGSVREKSWDESQIPLGEIIGLKHDYRVTRDGEGHIINTQPLKKD